MLHSDPRHQRDGEDEVEETFVGDGEDDEGRSEAEEDDHESVEVVIVWFQTVEEGNGEGEDEDEPADDLVADRKAFFGLERRDGRAGDQHCEKE